MSCVIRFESICMAWRADAKHIAESCLEVRGFIYSFFMSSQDAGILIAPSYLDVAAFLELFTLFMSFFYSLGRRRGGS